MVAIIVAAETEKIIHKDSMHLLLRDSDDNEPTENENKWEKMQKWLGLLYVCYIT